MGRGQSPGRATHVSEGQEHGVKVEEDAEEEEEDAEARGAHAELCNRGGGVVGGAWGCGRGRWAGVLGGRGRRDSLSAQEPGLLCSGGRTGRKLRLEPAPGIPQCCVPTSQFQPPLGFKRCLNLPRRYRGWAPS